MISMPDRQELLCSQDLMRASDERECLNSKMSQGFSISSDASDQRSAS